MESLIVSPLIQTIFDQLASPIIKEVQSSREFKKEIKKMEEELQMIQAVIEDAEEQQTKEKKIQIWLEKLKYVAYDIEDLLDEISIQVLREGALNRDVELQRQERKMHGGRSMQVSMKDIISLRIKDKVRMTCLFLKSVKNDFRMPRRLKAVRERLDDITKEMSRFQLKETGIYRRTDTITREKRETGPYVIESEVYGRDQDEEKIIGMLLECRAKGSVISIVGIGGIGKTTLAQLACRNKKVTNHFDLKMWISVYDNFNPRKIMGEMLDYVTKGNNSNGCISQLGLLQTQLMEALCGKRFLLVLDDLWSEDADEWDKIKILLGNGAHGSKIIVTTRSLKVAYMTSSTPPYYLNALSRDDCWTLFKQRAFQDGEEGAFPHLLPIGKRIVDKCKGVPLAAKVLGRLMCTKREESEWLHVQESDLWNLDGGGNTILSVQKLSYNHLPSHLKRCFAYCAVFPKNYVIIKEKLILQWIAAGLIQFPTGRSSTSPKITLEDIGNDYFNDLLGMSFLEASKCDESSTAEFEFKMHDFIHDLAKSVAGSEFLTLGNADRQSSPTQYLSMPAADGCFSKVRHALVECNLEPHAVPEPLCRAKKLHTIILLSLRDVSETAITNLVSGFKYLRILNLSGFCIKKLPKSIGDLIFLRYLDLSETTIEELPETICHLYKLQSINLSGCVYLQKLPRRMMLMRNLRHLNIRDCSRLVRLPDFYMMPTSFQTLPIFIVGSAFGNCLSNLYYLPNLRGELKIKHLENASEYASPLMDMQLHSLGLSWWDVDEHKQNQQARERRNEANTYRIDPKRLLESLKPSFSIKRLFINGYEGAEYPKWMNENTLRNLTHLELINLPKCASLPALGQLPALEVLHIQGMDSVISIDKEFYGCGRKSFSLLNELSMRDFPNLKIWESVDQMEAFPSLHTLTIINCPCLISMPRFPALQQLLMRKCDPLVVRTAAELQSLSSLIIENFPELLFIPKALPRTESLLLSLTVFSCPKLRSMPTNFGEFRALKSLKIGWCEELESLPHGLTNLTSLETLEIIQCPKLVSLPGESIKGLSSLRVLSIENCDGFSSLPIAMQDCTALERLTIMYCSDMAFLPDDLQHLSMLKSLTILSCAKLESLPEGLQFVTSLQNLEIRSCPNLMELPEWIGNLISLRSLAISDCSDIHSLPGCIQDLRAMQHLSIQDCPQLEERCKRDNGADWEKISHVPHLYIASSSLQTQA